MWLFFCHLSGLSTLQAPENKLRYNEVCFLTSHNSYAAKQHGYYYAQQRWTIKQQLEAGVRRLMLDTHLDSKTDKVILCHRSEWVNKLICAGKPHMLAHAALVTIREFLESHPGEIITIFLENYIHDSSVIDFCFKNAELEKYILSPSDWDPVVQDGWPTLAWMQEHNKRLVVFNSIEKTYFAYNQWQHVIENQWGSIYYPQACKERPESCRYRSCKRYLYVVNYFPRLKINFGNGYALINSSGLTGLLKALRKGLGGGYCKERMPNFISLDFVDEGDGMKFVNEINARTNGPSSRLSSLSQPVVKKAT